MTPIDRDAMLRALGELGFLLKIIPHVDGTLRICELVRYRVSGIDLNGRVHRFGSR